MSFLSNVMSLLPKLLPQQPTAPATQPSQPQSDGTSAPQSPFSNDEFEAIGQIVRQMLAGQQVGASQGTSGTSSPSSASPFGQDGFDQVQQLLGQLLGQGSDSFSDPSAQQATDAGAQAAASAVGSAAGAAQAAQAAQAQAPAATQAASPDAVAPASGNGPGTDRIRRTIDRMDPEHNPHYQPRGQRGTPQRQTYCNFFAQDFMRNVGVPRQNLPTGNATNMNHWLNNQGQQHGWRPATAAEARQAANNGQVVLASQPGSPHGHVAVVRPSSQPGVRIAQAGGHNYNDAPVGRGFRHPQYFVYNGPINGQTQSPASTTPATAPSATAPSTTDTATAAPSTATPSTATPATATPATQPPVQGPTSTNGQPLNLHDQFSSPDSTLSVAIGHAEGNRTVTGGRTRSYNGHTDPGNHAHNMGTFSYQGRGATTPEQADQVQLRRLQGQIPAYQQAAQRAGLDPNDPRLQAAYFDLWNQSPRMAGRFLQRMGSQLGGQQLTPENLARARANAAFDDNGRFTSTGLHNPQRAHQDQLRRENAIEAVLRQRGAV